MYSHQKYCNRLSELFKSSKQNIYIDNCAIEYSMRRVVKPLKIKKVQWAPEYHDTDQDGVPNYRDCNPWNPYQHRGVRPSRTMKKRLKQVNIFISEKGDKPQFYELTSKEAKKKIPKVQREVYSFIKKYPNVVGVTERIHPQYFMYISEPSEHESQEGRKSVVIRPPMIQRSKDQYKREMLKGVPRKYRKEAMEHIEETPYHGNSIKTIGRKRRRSLAGSSFHELRHVQQEERMGTKRMEIEGKKSHKSRRRHWKSHIEIDARQFAKKELYKRESKSEKITGEELIKILKL